MENISKYLESTNLNPQVTGKDIDDLIREAKDNNILGICVPPFWVKRANREIGNSDVLLVTVAGFPLGYNMTETKIEEIRLALRDGADEIDLVLNVSAFKDGMPWPKIELAKCSKLIHEEGKVIKVIIETAYLDHQEIIKACKLCADAGIDFVKTSTGFAPEGAKKEKIEIMRQALPSSVGIKASGGIKTFDQAKELIIAGADRLGTSSALAIINQQH
ncbi:MAG: deoxyribose-phosphate aldolase [Candidatus Cyclobacteriaceae bacterium M2_1C_046]